MNHFRQILTPPTFDGDSEKTRRAEILHTGSLLLFASALIIIWFNFQFGSQAEKSIIWLLGLIAALQIVIQWMIRSGYVNEASFILLTIGWAAMTEIARDVDGVRDIAIYGYILILLSSGYLLGWRLATVYTLASIAAIWWLAYMEAIGSLAPYSGNPYRIALDLTAIFILVFLVIYFLIKTLTNSLEQAQRELDERVRAEQALEKEQERLHFALDAAHMGTWDWEIETGAVSWSTDVASLFGMETEQFDGRYETYLSLIHPDDLPELQGAIQSALSGDMQDYIVIHRSIWPNGEIHWLEGRGKLYRDEEGKPIRMAGTVVDVTERKQDEEERERLIRELEAKNNELEQFTYTVSHDLKSPLITINGFLGYLEEDAAAGDVQRVKNDSQRIREAVDKMRLLMDELLELSRIGRLMNPPEIVSFEDLVREALEILHGQLGVRGIVVKLEPNLPTVYGDRQRLLEVLQNLIDNATKFMGEQPEPKIEIGQQGEENGKPIFFVRDNGIGIASEHHERVFNLFERLDPKTKGTGVGLTITKRIIEFHGGRIWVESEAGKGATFYFTLKCPPAAA